jgi:hypothetical protein
MHNELDMCNANWLDRLVVEVVCALTVEVRALSRQGVVAAGCTPPTSHPLGSR